MYIITDISPDVYPKSILPGIVTPDVSPAPRPHPQTAHTARLAAGQACLDAALMFLGYGISPLCCCDPDHIGVHKAHAKACDSPGKAPMSPWKAWQTTLPSAAEVRAHWARYPLGNLGIVLGQGAGVVRIDVDGAQGAALLAQWSAGDLPPTWAFVSPSGGEGWLYGWPKDRPCQTTTVAQAGTTHDELRLMGNGSQTIVPPSRHPTGGVYTWLPGQSPAEIALTPAPAWLLARLTPAPDTAPRSAWTGPTTADQRRVLEALALLPNVDVSYDDWLMVGMALHHSGAPWAREVWDTWSQGSAKFNAAKQAKSWASFGAKGGNRPRGHITLGWLFHRAGLRGNHPSQSVPDMTMAPAVDPVALLGQDPEGHVLPAYLANHPDPRVRKHWADIYRKANAMKQRMVQDPYATAYPSPLQGAPHVHKP